MSHTPGPWEPMSCGCRWTAYNTVAWCPLHAAAPDLLAALELLLRTPNDNSLGPALDAAHAAIAKAKGETTP